MNPLVKFSTVARTPRSISSRRLLLRWEDGRLSTVWIETNFWPTFVLSEMPDRRLEFPHSYFREEPVDPTAHNSPKG